MNILLVCVQKRPPMWCNLFKKYPYIRPAVPVVWAENLALSSK